jgi:hypothetical protein
MYMYMYITLYVYYYVQMCVYNIYIYMYLLILYIYRNQDFDRSAAIKRWPCFCDRALLTAASMLPDHIEVSSPLFHIQVRHKGCPNSTTSHWLLMWHESRAFMCTPGSFDVMYQCIMNIYMCICIYI